MVLNLDRLRPRVNIEEKSNKKAIVSEIALTQNENESLVKIFEEKFKQTETLLNEVVDFMRIIKIDYAQFSSASLLYSHNCNKCSHYWKSDVKMPNRCPKCQSKDVY